MPVGGTPDDLDLAMGVVFCAASGAQAVAESEGASPSAR